MKGVINNYSTNLRSTYMRSLPQGGASPSWQYEFIYNDIEQNNRFIILKTPEGILPIRAGCARGVFFQAAGI